MPVKRLENNIDLSTIVAGTGEFIPLGKTSDGSMVSIEVIQKSVSAAGVQIKVVESNSGSNWFDVLEDEDDLSSTTQYTTTSNTEPIALATDFVEFDQFGIFVDRPGGVTGELVVMYNSKPSFL